MGTKYRNSEKGRKQNRDYQRQISKTPERAKKRNAHRIRTNKNRLDYLRQFNNRFKRMKEKDPTMAEIDDIALKYLAAELLDPETDKARKDQIAFKLLPFTSRAKPTAVEHTGEITHTQLISREASLKLEQLLFDDPSVVKTISKDDDE